MNDDLQFDLNGFINGHTEFNPPYDGDYEKYVVDSYKYKLFLKCLVNINLHDIVGSTQEERITNLLKENFICAVVGDFISIPEGAISNGRLETLLNTYYNPLLKRGIENKSLKYVQHILKHIDDESVRLWKLSKGQIPKKAISRQLIKVMTHFEVILTARIGLERLSGNIADNLYLFDLVNRNVLKQNKTELIEKYGLDDLYFECEENDVIRYMEILHNVDDRFNNTHQISSDILNILLR